MNEKCGECVKIRRAEIVEEKMLCIQVHKTYSCLCTLCVLRMCDRITAFQFSRIQRKMPNSDNNQKCDIDFCCIAHRCAVTFLDLRALVACCSFSCRICLHAWQKEIRHRRLPHTGISWHSNKLNPICRMHKEWLVWVGCVCALEWRHSMHIYTMKPLKRLTTAQSNPLAKSHAKFSEY